MLKAATIAIALAFCFGCGTEGAVDFDTADNQIEQAKKKKNPPPPPPPACDPEDCETDYDRCIGYAEDYCLVITWAGTYLDEECYAEYAGYCEGAYDDCMIDC